MLKGILKTVLIMILMGLFLVPAAFSQTVNIMTYNIRVDIPADTANSWNKRKDALTALINFYEPDIIGIQEALSHQLQYILDRGTSYSFVGVGRTDGGTQGEYSAIVYNKDRFEVIRDSTFWLSETPEKPSRGWDAAYDRVCTFALLLDKNSGKSFWVFNTHFDNRGAQARLNGARLIMQRIEEARITDDYPVLFMGDLNCEENEDPIQYISNLLNDSRTVSLRDAYGPVGTYNDFDINSNLQRKIDYIFTDRNGINVHKYASIDDRYGSKWPSDHLPVMVEIELE